MAPLKRAERVVAILNSDLMSFSDGVEAAKNFSHVWENDYGPGRYFANLRDWEAARESVLSRFKTDTDLARRVVMNYARNMQDFGSRDPLGEAVGYLGDLAVQSPDTDFKVRVFDDMRALLMDKSAVAAEQVKIADTFRGSKKQADQNKYKQARGIINQSDMLRMGLVANLVKIAKNHPLKGSEAIEAIRAVVPSEDPFVRCTGICSLFDLGTEDSLREAFRLMSTEKPSENVNEFAINTIARRFKTGVFFGLEKDLYNHLTRHVRSNKRGGHEAIEALGDIGTRDSIEAMTRICQESDGYHMGTGLMMLERIMFSDSPQRVFAVTCAADISAEMIKRPPKDKGPSSFRNFYDSITQRLDQLRGSDSGDLRVLEYDNMMRRCAAAALESTAASHTLDSLNALLPGADKIPYDNN
jgi:hypothetical protein